MDLENEQELEFLPKKFVSKRDMQDEPNMSMMPRSPVSVGKKSRIMDEQEPLPGMDSARDRLYTRLRGQRSEALGQIDQANDNLVQNQLGGLLAQTSSKMGTLGGKRSEVANFQPLVQSIYQRDTQPAINALKMDEADRGYELKRQALYEKMLGRQQKMSETETAQGYKAQELDLKAQRQKELERSNQEREKLGQERLGVVKDKEQLKADKVAQGKPLSPDQLLKYGEGRNMPQLLNNFRQEMGNYKRLFGPMKGKFGDMNAYNAEAQKFSSVARLTAQAVGKYLEGGKMTDADVPKYEAMLPNIKDLPQVAEYKLNQVEKLLRDRHTSDIEALRRQGYDVAGLELAESKTAPTAGTMRLESQQYSKSRNQTRKIYSDGVNKKEVFEDGDTTQ